MKKFCIFISVFVFIGGLFSVNAQDIIVLRDGNMVEAKVTETSAGAKPAGAEVSCTQFL